MDRKYYLLHEEVGRVMTNNTKLADLNQELKIEMYKDMKALEDTKEDVKALKACYKFEDRISALEGKAKSDLFAVQRTCQEALDADKYNLKRSEAVKLMYSVQVDAA